MPVVQSAIAQVEGPKPGLMIHRQGPIGENSRNASGGTEWQIERRHPWAIQAGSYDTIPDNDENIVFVGGVRVWLPLIPKAGEKGVVVLLRGGQLHVEAIDG